MVEAPDRSSQPMETQGQGGQAINLHVICDDDEELPCDESDHEISEEVANSPEAERIGRRDAPQNLCSQEDPDSWKRSPAF